MNKVFFDALVKDRSDSAKTLEKPSMRGVKSSVVDKYSDQAHFVYELLQNADDTKATYAKFKLYHDRLVFIHNGTQRFSVSNPETEEKDREEGCLGDVNAILSIGNSTKTDQNTIGKFGVGFKAVFQYTSTPYIYDPNIRFKIERFFVPVLIEEDHSERAADETLFEFPFNHETNTADIAFDAISERLSSLVNPILFLSNLQEISFEFDDTKGNYRKTIEQTYVFDDTKAELIALSQTFDEESVERKLWLFSRNDDSSGRYSVGFYLDDEDNLMPVNEYAYCFFPTKADTGLHFIIHAPFLLTDSREGIKQGDPHNTRMIDCLAVLAADCLLYLRDIGIQEKHRLITDNILDIVPTESFSQTDYWGTVVKKSEFEPFYEKMLEAFKTEEIIPTADSYTTSENAYWSYNLKLSSLFDNDALKAITEDVEAEWIFTSIPREKCDEDDYVDEIIVDWLNEDRILNRINESFIESRSIEWLAEFYSWISENSNRMKRCRTLPIFISAEGRAVPAYDREGKLILFLPTGEESDYVTISDTLLENDDIAAFVNELGITKPSLKSEIYNKLLPRLRISGAIDVIIPFKKIFDYYINECPEVEKDSLISELKKYQFIRYTTSNSSDYFRDYPNIMYFPSEKLKEYFSVKPDTKFVDWEGYLDLVGKENEKFLRSFFVELGISTEIRIFSTSLSWDEAHKMNISWKSPSYAHWNSQTWEQYVFDACKENIDDIVTNNDFSRSVYMWDILLKMVEQYPNLSEKLKGKHKYFNRTSYDETFDSTDALLLRTSKWLRNKEGEFVSPSMTYASALADEYDIFSSNAKRLIGFLKMPYENPELSNLTTEQKKAVKAVELLKNEGIDVDSLTPEQIKKIKSVLQDEYIQSDDSFDSEENNDSHLSTKKKKYGEGSEKTKQRRTSTPEIEDDVDSDEYTPKTVDYQKKIEKAKAKSDAEIDLIEQMEELQQKALDSKRYTFGWFKALLELEARESNENADNSKEVSISFGKVVPEGASNRTLILKQPSSYIPRFMEELADIPLILVFENETKKLPIEVISIRSFTLRVKLKPNADMSDINFNAVKEARITAQNPVFLLEELKNQFAKLELDDDYDMQENLCSNIDFVFGPPGTGKTTYLANEIIIPMMKCPEKCRVLVLTPTNKASDVITKKIQEMMGEDTSYLNWLVRFGSTDDETIEKSGVFKDKTFDLRGLDHIVTVTTIDRFPYDFFMPNGERHYIRNQKYDYIIFDEASMIPLVKIIYPLFHRQPRKFIVAGDPFQIEPVVHLDMWKGENIYTMVKLNSFSEPKTIPYDYDVKLLTTQYRSIPIIGDLFSRMTYDGVLKHNRTSDDQVQINFGEQLDVRSMNIIKFPVSKYESIYRTKRLNGKTPYHIYSALFAYEFTAWLSNNIALHNPQKRIRIGVIAAYKAQADMIEHLISSLKLPDTVSIQTGTIHGFQGDECEIIISVYNPPPSISRKDEMFLNKKNIINVSISRARDYLFILMPDDETENVDNLLLIKKMESIIKESDDYTEYSSNDIEQLMFGKPNYLEGNSFSTSHQSVNVYGLPEQKYEIRSEDNAIDIQIHK